MANRTEENVVKIEVRNVYGNQLIYPANEAAEIFCQIAGKKTLDMSDLKRINSLGFLVVEKCAPKIMPRLLPDFCNEGA